MTENYRDRYERKLAVLRLRAEIREAHDVLPDTFCPGAPLPARLRAAFAKFKEQLDTAKRATARAESEATRLWHGANPERMGR